MAKVLIKHFILTIKIIAFVLYVNNLYFKVKLLHFIAIKTLSFSIKPIMIHFINTAFVNSISHNRLTNQNTHLIL